MGIKISELNPLETPADGDIIPIVDMDAGETKYIEFADLLGPEGPAGPAGADGEEVTIRVDGGYIQWRLGDGEWENLIAVSSLVGPQGEQGIQGPEGPAATLNWMGAWSALTEYDPLDVVSHEGVTYLCIATSTDDEPPDPVHWNAIGAEILDALIGSTRGGLLCRGAGGWVLIEPDTAGYVLTDGGAGADPAWATLATLLNQILTTRGDLLYRGSGDAARLAKGSQYSVLSMGADDPAWTYLYSTRILVLPATAFNVDAANPPEEYLVDGTYQEVATLAFDDTTEETAQAPAFVVPADINTGGTITFALVGWAKTAAAGKNVKFRVKQLVLSSGAGSVDTAYSTASDSGDLACDATQERPVIYTWTAAVSSLGWSAGQRVRLAISRIAPSANNLTGDFLVESFEVRVPTRVM